MNLTDEKWWLSISDLQLEQELKRKLLKEDPAKVDLSESFFKNMHQQIMQKLECNDNKIASSQSETMLNNRIQRVNSGSSIKR